MSKNLLYSLNLPEDLPQLSQTELEQLAAEIREELLLIGNECGGHLASNLGVVELSIALHAVFESPKDKFIFDTSHQCYVHKILTGRRDKMRTIRQEGGLSGFAKISESPHDIFGAGHASTALSAALGVAEARNILNEDYSVAAIIGDSSLSGGMAYEALNNIGKLDGNFICILNDNDMAISRPVGNMSEYITRIRTSQSYNTVKEQFERILERIPKIGVPLKRKIEKTVDRVRDLVLDFKVGVIFEEFGFRYIGPIDGHNIPMVMAALKYAKSYNGPIMIHMITVKGKGHTPAEADPIKYHGVSPKKKAALPEKVEKPTQTIPAPPQKSYTEVFGETCIDIAKRRNDVVVITPAMTGGSGLTKYAETFPDRFFDVGIAEEHAVTFCGGLSKAGIKPILSIYSTFLQRGYDQVIHDICLQDLPMVFALDRAGIVGEDGPTHHGIFDYAFLLSIPKMCILAPKDTNELTNMLNWAVEEDRIVSIRYPKGPGPEQNGRIESSISTLKAEVLQDFQNEHPGEKVVVLAAGSMAWPAAEAAKVLQEQGHNVAAINLRFIKPLDTQTIQKYIDESAKVIVVEEGCKIGGISAYIRQSCPSKHSQSDWISIGIDDVFVNHGKIASLRKQFQLSVNGIIDTVQNSLRDTEIILDKNKIST